MPKPHVLYAARGHRSSRASSDASRTDEPSPERRSQLALNRFTYRGGFDGYEGRMILRPDFESASHPKDRRPSPKNATAGA